MAETHILLVTFPAQGHINPSLQFAKRLSKHGVKITFLTSLYATSRMSQPSSFHGGAIDLLSFSDGSDAVWSVDETPKFMQALNDHGSKAVEDAVAARRAEGRPFTRVIYTLLVPWAGQVAHRVGVPSTLLWIQPAIVFGVYFHCYNKSFDAADEVIELPGLPVLRRSDLPSFFHDTNPSVYDFAIPTFTENFEMLDREDHPAVLLNTFDALELEPLRVLTNKYKLMPIGPLIPSAFLDGNDPTDKSFGADLIQKSEDYVQFLDSAEKETVIYVAFGSYSELSKPQMEAIEEGLIRSGRPFLWVIRGSENREKVDGILSRREELEKRGKIVAWCTQVEVLSHPSVGCFVTHCGWNSTLESLAAGVPLVALPQWTDQATNAKLVQDYWRSGVRAVKKEGNGEIVEADEIERCLEIVMGGGEMREQAKKWRDLAKEAIKEDGTSNVNLKIFVDQMINH
ncbi:hypothetical protein C2S52_006286 [Perilla frutescens var. hirtella]|nr:hypothetical protein C2S51_009500 [Perilla frutescens var. frutescens]KAH6786734.1 hypothetical protein C2S52_006286 [Perilla frutescens var. hirtella]